MPATPAAKSILKKHVPAWTGLAASTMVGLLVAVAVSRDGSGFAASPIAFAGVLAVGSSVSILMALRLRSVAVGTMLGIASGTVSAMQLLSQPIMHPFAPVAATLGFFVIMGFVLGGLVEFASFVHHLAHGGTPAEYPPR